MNITEEKVLVNHSAEEIFQFFLNPENFKQLMPEDISKFKANESGFIFALKGMPEVGLKLEENSPNSFVKYTSSKESLDFYLKAEINEINENSSEVQLLFEGKFNPFIKMMVEKPLTNFLKTLTENISKV